MPSHLSSQWKKNLNNKKDIKDKCRVTKDEAKWMRHGGRMKQEKKQKYSGRTINRKCK
jgi:hypothetical protein